MAARCRRAMRRTGRSTASRPGARLERNRLGDGIFAPAANCPWRRISGIMARRRHRAATHAAAPYKGFPPRHERSRRAGRRAVRIILLPDFTLTAFSGLVDVLRLASDEGDNSRPRRCSWEYWGRTRNRCGRAAACRSRPGACSAVPMPTTIWSWWADCCATTPEIAKATLDFIRAAGGSRTTLVGVCTGAFALMRAGAERAPGLRQLVFTTGTSWSNSRSRRSAGGRPALRRGPPPHHLLGRSRFD